MLINYYNNPSEVINYSHSKADNYYRMDFHLHEFFEIYFFISGKVNYFIEKQVHQLNYGDLIIMNNHEIHKPSVFPGETYERIVIHFDPSIVSPLSPSNFNLLNCFINRSKGEYNKLSLNNEQINQILSFFYKIEGLSKSYFKDSSILKLTCFLELLVYINKLYYLYKNSNSSVISNDFMISNTSNTMPEKLILIMDYIDKHSDNDLSLDNLGKVFFIDKYYLSRLFKKHTGSNIRDYILYKRISKAKRLLAEGNSTTETSIKCGFNDYSNFYRMFKKAVGVPPSKYKSNL